MILQVIIGLCISYIMLFVLSIILKDNSIADIFWGLAFLQVAIHLMILTGPGLPEIIFFLLILIWSLRIAGYIFSKKLRKKVEDPRYQEWRKKWKHFYIRSFFQVYILQGCLASVVAIPIFLVMIDHVSINSLFIAGVIIAVIGLIYETIADIQLARFVKIKKKGQIMRKGLWRYSRHPNYFGESLFWFGVSIIAVQVSFIALISWLTITLLLRFVSGVPMAEARYKDNKEFQKYKSKTPPMIPRFWI